MRILESKFVQGFIKMADDGFMQGWHERNGGNLSYRLKSEEVESIKPRLNAPGNWTPIGTSVPGLSGEYFLVTGSGKYFRNIKVDPEVCIAIIELDDKGENYRIRWGLVEGGVPTSELPSHLMNHEVKKRVTDGKHRVIYHAHTTNTIALTFVLPLNLILHNLIPQISDFQLLLKVEYSKGRNGKHPLTVNWHSGER